MRRTRKFALWVAVLLFAVLLAVFASYNPPADVASVAERIERAKPRPRQIAVRRPRPTLPEPTGRAKERARLRQFNPYEPYTVEPDSADTGEFFEDPEAHLFIEIVDTDGYPVELAGLAFRGDCGRMSYRVTDGEGELHVDPGECSLIAWRQDGALRSMSDRVYVDVDAGEELDVVLVLPAERTGGLGVQIEEHEDGVRVVMVVPGSPADAAGLEAGDIIVEVDGTSAAILSMSDFVQVMTGPEGSDVDFVVQYEEDTGMVEEPIIVTRAFLEG